jgi:outer membrane protein assembly factor BamD
MRISTLARLLLLIAGTHLISSCAGHKEVANPEKVCREGFAKAKKDYNKKRDVEAQQGLRDLTVNCAGYDFVEEAQYMLGQSHFRTEQWPEAMTEFGILVSAFDRSPYLEEAQWKICRAAFFQAPSWDRDPGLTQDAINRLSNFLQDWPTSVRADSARNDQADLISRLARKRFETGALYLKMDEPLAATTYLNLLIKEYPEWPRINEGRLKLAQAYIELDQFERAQETLDQLRSLEGLSKDFQKSIANADKDLTRQRASFEKRKAREAEEARQGKL